MLNEQYEKFAKLNIYQIYPRSFMDSNNDGNGDLVGIISKLDYLKELNINAIWISPFFSSPMVDNGYDISDYLDINPIFGTFDDFKKLIFEAHKRGIKVIVDLVANHCSTKHRWFQEAIKDKNSKYHDYFYFFDEKLHPYKILSPLLLRALTCQVSCLKQENRFPSMLSSICDFS